MKAQLTHHILPMLFLDKFEIVICGIKFHDKQNYEKFENIW